MAWFQAHCGQEKHESQSRPHNLRRETHQPILTWVYISVNDSWPKDKQDAATTVPRKPGDYSSQPWGRAIWTANELFLCRLRLGVDSLPPASWSQALLHRVSRAPGCQADLLCSWNQDFTLFHRKTRKQNSVWQVLKLFRKLCSSYLETNSVNVSQSSGGCKKQVLSLSVSTNDFFHCGGLRLLESTDV